MIQAVLSKKKQMDFKFLPRTPRLVCYNPQTFLYASTGLQWLYKCISIHDPDKAPFAFRVGILGASGMIEWWKFWCQRYLAITPKAQFQSTHDYKMFKIWDWRHQRNCNTQLLFGHQRYDNIAQEILPDTKRHFQWTKHRTLLTWPVISVKWPEISAGHQPF